LIAVHYSQHNDLETTTKLEWERLSF